MHADKQSGRREPKRSAAEEAHASECRTVVITDARHAPDRAKVLTAFIRRKGHRGRFDLLTVADPWKLADPGGKDLFEQVVADTRLLATFHKGEQVIVATYSDPSAIVKRLAAHPEIKGGLAVHGVDLRGRSSGLRVTEDVGLACADFRQHDEQKGRDLPEHLRKALLLEDRPALLAVPGGANSLAEDSPRRRIVIAELEALYERQPFQRLALAVHTDCAALGGNKAFIDGKGLVDAHVQHDALVEMLHQAILFARERFPGVTVRAAIVRLKDGQVFKVIPVIR